MKLLWSRRQALLLGLLAPPVSALGALSLAHHTDLDGLVPPRLQRALKALSPREFATLDAAFGRLLHDPSGVYPTPTYIEAAVFAEGYLSGLPPGDLRELRGLLALLEHVFPLGVGSGRPFTALSARDQDTVLASLEGSSVGLVRVGFTALKQLAALSFFRHPSTFPMLGYEGPRTPPSSERVRGTPLPLVRDVDLRADVVVVGAGAGGSMAARELARAGASVVLLEEGPDHPPESFTQREDEALATLYQDRGARTTADRAIMVLQGRGLGGSTIHNQNLCKRTPPELLERWVEEHGLEDWSPRDCDALFEEVERDLGVRPIPDGAVNTHNRLLEDGARRLGWRHGRLAHNRDGCVGSGFCELGCVYDGKNNARKVLLPEASRRGARIRADTLVDRVLHRASARGGREVYGVEARDTRTGRRVTVHARCVVLAASAVGSAAVALRSALPDPYGRLGRGLRLHPGAVCAGLFDEEVLGWRGVPQSVECTEHLDFSPGSDRRVWIVPVFAHPVGTAALFPGFGGPWLRALRTYPQVGALVAMVHDETEGRVVLKDHRASLEYAPSRGDRAQLARGLRACAELLLAAGARRALVATTPPTIVRRASELDALGAEALGPHRVPLTAVHPMGAMTAGRDPRRSVCDPGGAHHQVAGLFVADGGLFPTSLGVPPQVSIYAVGLRVGRSAARWLAR
ncbi:MAG: FAD-dependent oxidoreductase [Deltaproteobacteria bacterium]|nr:FAD-dependent oxidoreductase [Deltaproteobacteria bacterium]